MSKTVGIDDRWHIKPGSALEVFTKMEKMIISGTVADVVNDYPELSNQALSVQLPMFVQHCRPTNLHSAQVALSKMSSEMRQLFNQVEQVIRLLLVCPSTSCDAERSFSALRRLKTWLRNSIGQIRLNSAAICNIHKEHLDKISDESVAAEFAGTTEIRRSAFGRF